MLSTYIGDVIIIQRDGGAGGPACHRDVNL